MVNVASSLHRGPVRSFVADLGIRVDYDLGVMRPFRPRATSVPGCWLRSSLFWNRSVRSPWSAGSRGWWATARDAWRAFGSRPTAMPPGSAPARTVSNPFGSSDSGERIAEAALAFLASQ